MEKFLTTEDVAARLGRSVSAVKRDCQQGRFPGAWKPTKRSSWLIPEGAVKAFHQPKMGRPTTQPRPTSPAGAGSGGGAGA